MIIKIKNVGVIGLGIMGFDIAFLYAMKGFPTLAYDASAAILESFFERRDKTIERLERRRRITQQEKENVIQQLQVANDIKALTAQDLVTEAVFENAKVKATVYKRLNESGFAGILTTNTSSLTRETLLASGSYRRESFATTHYFNPVLHTKMVELVRGDMEEQGFNCLHSFLNDLGRMPVATRDISGFVSNSVLMYYAVMALRLLESGAQIEQVDQEAKRQGLLPPFISFDSWKPSIVEDVTRVMFELRGDRYLRSSKLLASLAQKNPSFYLAQKPNPDIYHFIAKDCRAMQDTVITNALKTILQIAAARTVELGENPATVDYIAVEGLKTPNPPLAEIDKTGATTVLERLEEINRAMPENPLTPPALLSTMASQGQSFFKNNELNPWITSYQTASETHASH